MGTLHLYTDYQELQNFEVCLQNAEKSDTSLPCTSPHSEFLCSSAEVTKHRKNNLQSTPQSLEIWQALNKLCEEYKEMFFYFIKVI